MTQCTPRRPRFTAFFCAATLLMLSASAVGADDLPGLDRPAAPRPGLPTLNTLLGFEPGARHPRNDELVRYYRALAEVSDRMTIETIGRSSGGREQVLAVFGTPDRLARLDDLRRGRIEASRDGEGPVVVWLGYSVHGNEASGASAAPIVAWWLAASDDPEVAAWLEHVVVVMEPVINPDGVDRFAHWANMHRGRNPSADPNDREHNEGWPNGRTSYYWFDLNRDWLPLTHPVSRNRIRHYRQWRPHVLTDVHEMGSRSTYFFQPGIPERNNPATPERVYALTARIAEYHAERLDAAGEPYYSRESFDDYYLGKGSTYPDLTGGVGILFEQGSSRGHVMDTPYGRRTFAEAIANQVRTSLSTLEASVALRDELRAHQADFFAEALDNDRRGGWLLGDGGDPARAERLLAMLVGHGIDVRTVSGAISIDGREFPAGSAWAIPARQDLGRFVEAIFDTPTELPMETFYDVSAWPLQYAFDLPLEPVRRLPATGAALTEATLAGPAPDSPAVDAVAWAIDWRQHRAPAVLAALLADGYRVQAAEAPMTLQTSSGTLDFDRGSVVVHGGIQPDHLAPVAERLAALGERHAVAIHAVRSGLARDGLDLGSPSLPVIEPPRAALLTGDGLNPYSAGALWRWFDVHLDQPVTMLDVTDLPGELDDYTHLLLPGGRYDGFGDAFEARLVEFVRGGGQLIAVRNAAAWVESLDLGWSFIDEEAGDADPDTTPARYADFELDAARRLIGGSALAVTLDPTHPLGWGYGRARSDDADDRRDDRRDNRRLVLFRQGAHVLKTTDNRYARPARYTESPLVAGYLAAPVAEELAATTAIGADRFGGGLVVRIADDVVFRGYWAGAERLLANALFHGQQVRRTNRP
ncbi:peptidase M14 [Wenzhouxiangella sp. XN79A]|uniref:M14 family zinc carboxypeptidase n=1 Tax=Wenzhouxiangella sp. XN79A TaxID=2724193 RepID=UPI00144A8ED7|nr:M14 family zinc carboxypeptidase [Wenzhouxiangella sp. XN79A]NKI35390.1 peptidase M14 [Wenzhouxiangella sp. XN79A]